MPGGDVAMTSPARSPGHVFIARGDLTRLACDAWLLPSNETCTVARYWVEALPREPRAAVEDHLRDKVPPDRWGDPGRRTLKLTVPAGVPRPWLVDVGGIPGTSASWYVVGLREFLEEAAAHLSGPPLFRRERPLLAVPLLGSGLGGARDIQGELVRALLQEMYEFVAHHAVDVALVTWTTAAFAAAQHERSRLRTDPWPELDERQREDARALAAQAHQGNLVLFLGAGVSTGAGLPSWEELLEWLARDADLTSTELEALRQFNHLDQARLLDGRLKVNEVDLGKRIAERFEVEHTSLAHSLTAGLPVNEVVTTNYDELFEQASKAAGRPATVVPYGEASGSGRWLLKLHGTISYPEDIVLTREDFLRYSDQRQALAGIVHALLMTRHMLFVGFSLRDDNFHRIADDVRKVVRRAGRERRPFGTALVIERDVLMEELWDRDVDCVTLGSPRRLEIFLDFVLAQASTGAGYLLDPDFDAVLTPAEAALRDALVHLKRSVGAEVRSDPVWQPVAGLLRSLGDQSP